MKKIILIGITALFALALITCIDSPVGGTSDNSVPFVQSYSPDKVVINLDGYGDVESGRALSLPIAQETYNFLEVVFVADSNEAVAQTLAIARASWERGKAMSITGVNRGTAALPVTYGVDIADVDNDGSDNIGAAIMFVGRKIGNEVTLLAIGKIIEVDGVTTDEVTPTSKNVTFGLVALVSNTKFTGGTPNTGGSFEITSLPASNSSGDIPEPVQFTYPGTSYTVTAYSLSETALVEGDKVIGEYTLDGSSTTITIGNLLPAVITVALDTTDPDTWKEGYQPVEPVYLKPNGEKIQLEEFVPGNYSGKLTSLTAGSALVNPIEVEIEAVFDNVATPAAFYFSIPVVAITASSSTASTPIPAQKWYIKPGYNTLYLDNGTVNSPGGSIFIYSAPLDLDTLTISTK